MLSLRRALLTAAAVITFFYVFTSLQAPAETQPRKHVDVKAPGPKADAASSDGTKFAKQPEQKVVQQKESDLQKPMIDFSKMSLIEQLQYQFPYDPTGKFPAYIWQTWKTDPSDGAFPDYFRVQEASWTELHPEFVHEVITDDTADRLIRYLYASVPDVLAAYRAMPVPVLKADFFRYLILLARGGIYSDIDTEVLQPATEWLPKGVSPASVGLIIGIEADPDREDWAKWYARRIQFCQWTIQAKVGHPVLRKIVAQITEETLRRKRNGQLRKNVHDNIIEFTGPAIWTDIVFDYFNDPNYFDIKHTPKNITWENFTGMETPRKVGDVIVLPITSFSPGIMTMGAGETDDPMAFVKHDFEGTWKEDWEQVKPVIDHIKSV